MDEISVAVVRPIEHPASTGSAHSRDRRLEFLVRLDIPVSLLGPNGTTAIEFQTILEEEFRLYCETSLDLRHIDRATEVAFGLEKPDDQQLWKPGIARTTMEQIISFITINQCQNVTSRQLIVGPQIILAVLALRSQSLVSTGGQYTPTLGAIAEANISQGQARLAAVKASCVRPSPSTGAKVAERRLVQIESRSDRAYNYRPALFYGPSILIYEKAFAVFLQDIDTHIPTSAELEHSHEFVSAALDFYHDEDARQFAMENPMRYYMGIPAMPTTLTYNTRIKPDGARVCTQHLRDFQPISAFFELKNEIGEGGSDPFAEAECDYAAVYLSFTALPFLGVSHCPAFLVGMAGPNIMIGGAIFSEGFISQPLTDYVSIIPRLGTHERSPFDDAAHRVAKIFYALKKGVNALDTYYSQLVERLYPLPQQPDMGTASSVAAGSTPRTVIPPSPESIGPHFRTYVHPDGGDVELTYKKRLCDVFHRTVFIAEQHRHEHESTQVIVKFAYRYNPDAHRLLASRKFAPRLYFCERLPDVGGLWVVVMEYCTGRHITGPSSLSTHAPQLRAALKLLHDQNLVFGGLRSANILIKEDKLLLIDFDWCGKAGKAQYPSDILLAEGKFHRDVQKGGLLQIEHDKYLFRQLTGEEL